MSKKWFIQLNDGSIINMNKVLYINRGREDNKGSTCITVGFDGKKIAWEMPGEDAMALLSKIAIEGNLRGYL